MQSVSQRTPQSDSAEEMPLLPSCKFEFDENTGTMIIDLQVAAKALGSDNWRNKIKQFQIK